METLNYKVLEGTGYNGYILKDAPVKVMQFGEGNFLRAFVDYFYDIANEKAGYNGKVKLVQPISNFPQMADWINEQEGLYTLYLRGSEKGQKVDAKRVISCVSDCVCPYIDGKWDEVLELARSADLETIVSNTTEAGIAYTQGDSQFDQVPPNSFPAKLTRVLFERYKAFNGAADKGLTILSCELIDNNGKELKKCCNNYAKDWDLEPAFIDWMNNANTFCSTLVDRIVPGRIRDPKEMAALEEANGYTDKALDVGEVFGVRVIEYGLPGFFPGPDGRCDDGEVDEIIDIMKREGVTSVVALPTHMRAVAEAAGGSLSLRSMLLSAEYVPEEDVMLFEESFGCRVYEHYGMTEMGLGCAVSCGHGDGYHIREADLYIEIIDPETGRVIHDDTPGEVVFTTLTRKGMPFIRYRTGDMSRWITEPCPCGSVLKRLARVNDRNEVKGYLR